MSKKKEYGPGENPAEFESFKELVNEGLVDSRLKSKEEVKYAAIGEQIIGLRDRLEASGLTGDQLLIAVCSVYGKSLLMTYKQSVGKGAITSN